MTYRQAIWGLSNGITVLTLGGVFWLLLAIGMGLRPAVPVSTLPVLLPISMALLVGGFAWMSLGAARLRRKATGFTFADIRNADEQSRRESRTIIFGMRWVTIGQATAIALVGFFCYYYQRPEFAWPLIGLILSLHFAALAPVFGVRTYYATGFAGSCISLAALLRFEGSRQFMVLGFGMGSVAWLSAVYLLLNADRMANQWRSSSRANGPAA